MSGREKSPPGSGQNHLRSGEREPGNSGSDVSATPTQGGMLVVSFQRPLPSYLDRSITWVSFSMIWFWWKASPLSTCLITHLTPQGPVAQCEAITSQKSQLMGIFK